MRTSSFGTALFLLLLLSYLDSIVPGLRYAKYAIPILCVIFWLQGRDWRIHTNAATLPFFALLCLSLALIPFANTYGISDLYFYFTALAPFILAGGLKMRPEKTFLLSSAIYAISIAPEAVEKGLYYSLLESSSVFEQHTFAFVFGLYTVYFLCTKNYRYLALSIALSILVLKRVSLLAIILIFFLNLLPKKQLSLLTNPWLMVSINALSIAITYTITTDWFNELCLDYFNMTASHLTMGRNILYQAMYSEHERGWFNFLFGSGLGITYNLAAETIDLSSKVNFHNDIVKIYLESGLVIFLLFFYLLYKHKGPHLFLLIYVNSVLFTDNISTYALVMFTYFFLSGSLMRLHEPRIIQNYSSNTYVNDGKRST